MAGTKKKGYLRLVSSNSNIKKYDLRDKIENLFSKIFISKNEKIYTLKDVLINIYRDYEITTGVNDIPYFVKAENKIRQIVKENKIDYYYSRLKKFKRNV